MNIKIALFWIPIAFCTFLRVILLKNSYTLRAKLDRLLFLIIIPVAANYIQQTKAVTWDPYLIVLILIFIYIMPKLIQKAKGGYIESLYAYLNCTLVSVLSFTNFVNTIIISFVLILLSILIYKVFSEENRSGFWEIVILCSESILVSIVINVFNLFDIWSYFQLTLFSETVLYIINCLLIYLLKIYYNEDIDQFICELRE